MCVCVYLCVCVCVCICAVCVFVYEYLCARVTSAYLMADRIILDDTTLHLVVWFQMWNSSVCGLPNLCHYSLVHSDPDWLYLSCSHPCVT